MKIQLTMGEAAIVSPEDYQFLSQFKWHVSRSPRTSYAITHVKGKTVYMHRLIMAAPQGLEVDHINNDGLDNRRANLRLCTSAENKANMRIRVDNKSGYKGINFDKQTGKWRARIRFNNKEYSLGRHITKDAAVKAREEAQTLHGEFARLS